MATKRETREVKNFDSVSLSGEGNLVIEQGDQEGLVIEADEGLLPYLKSEVKEGKLKLGIRSWLDALFLWPRGPVHYSVQMKQVAGVSFSGSGRMEAKKLTGADLKLEISGSGEMSVAEVEYQDLELSISGSGTFSLAGSVAEAEVRISGSGKVRGESLQTQEASVRISGAGDVNLKVEKKLEVSISGSGTVRYDGKPAVTQRISGAGHVGPLHE